MTDLFVRPWALVLLAAAPLLAFVLRRIDARCDAATREDLGPRAKRLGAAPARSLASSLLPALGLALAAVALAQPVWGDGPQTAAPRGADVVVCLDVSRSMLAQDEEPTRLARARREIAVLAARAKGSRMALVAFAGEARVIVPLTRDLASFTSLVAQVDEATVTRGGTDLGAALAEAARALPRDSADTSAVLLLTDGEDLAQTGLRAAESLRRRGVVVHCVGLGSSGGAKIAVAEGGGTAFLRGEDGRDIVSSMDAAALRRIAEATGGTFVASRSGPDVLVGLFDEHVQPRVRRATADEERRERTQRFQAPLLAAFAAWGLSFLPLVRRRR